MREQVPGTAAHVEDTAARMSDASITAVQAGCAKSPHSSAQPAATADQRSGSAPSISHGGVDAVAQLGDTRSGEVLEASAPAGCGEEQLGCGTADL